MVGWPSGQASVCKTGYGGSNPPPTSTPLKPLGYQWGFFVVGQLLGRLGQNLKSNRLLIFTHKILKSKYLL
jgi:hypothetical protein